jgi:eukaryotic-like serine/threonine-protein kinase
MATSQAIESFWIQLTESRLVPAAQIQAISRELETAGVVSDAVAAKNLVQRGLLTRYQADRLLEGRSRGFFFDDYKLLDLLGVGGMGWVYRAENAQTHEIFALKVLLDQLKHDRGLLARFEQEARAGQRFNHENIVRTFGNGAAGGLPYVIMEYVEGPSLLELLRFRDHSRLPWEQACDIARQAARGLHHVHVAGFVHRDIKPQNLLIDRKGLVKILDFGLSMLKDGEEGDEFSMAMIFGHECVGTAAYTAPEQALDSLTADARSDIYSLGCTLFASLTGDTPFPFAKTSEVLKAHQTQVARNVSDIVPSIPRAVGNIVAKMLAKKPEDRFATATEVVDALSVWSQTAPVEFDFRRILAERTKGAQEKLREYQKQQRAKAGGTSSTARLTSTSSVASTASGSLPTLTIPSSASSVARRGPFGFENQPAILVRQQINPEAPKESRPTTLRKSTMALVPLAGGEPIPLLKDPFVIGRRVDCDLQVQDASVSSRHCELRFDGQYWTIVDLNSRNGIRVNGEPVQKQRLHAGDTIVIGPSLRLRYGNPRGEAVARMSSRFRRVLLAIILLAVIAATLAAGYWYWYFGR